ncbi:NAD+ kinase, partial [Geosmithia morbida]
PSFELHEDAADSADGDEDHENLEVTFDPSNPYRRKSSLVASETTSPRLKSAQQLAESTRGECLVHHFLDNQRRPPDGANVTAGQPDQQAWTSEMTKSVSELDLTSYSDDVRSRMLSKKQLSDMAWGVRELSRRLSSMRIRFHVRSVFLLTKIYDQELLPKTRELTRWLLHKDRDTPYVVYLEDKLRTNKRFDVEGLLDQVAADYASGRDEDGGPISYEAARSSVAARLRYWDERMCRQRPHTFDFVITLGGDGTVLYASWLFQRIVPPVLSFSLGSLGFLTKFDFDSFAPTLTSVFRSGVTVSLRLRFEGTIMRSQPIRDTSDPATGDESSGPSTPSEALPASGSGGDNQAVVHQYQHERHHHHRERRDLVEELVGEEKEDVRTHRPGETFEILNEIVVDRGPNPTMSSTELFGDDEHFTSILADGICVSTPTGSTAYNLAAGGSLCHPENPVMLVTSICPHALSFRPIILPDTMVLRVGVPYDARTSSWASFDGRERVELHPGDYVTISASRYPFASVQAEGRRSEDWINSISGKLGWNTRQRQKGYKEWDK